MSLEQKSMGLRDAAQALVIGRRPKRTLLRLAALITFACVLALIFRFVLTPVRITGPSMYPTFNDGSLNVVNRLAYLHADPKRGDVVAIRFSPEVSTDWRHLMYVKRIVGMPGESVRFKDGRFCVNGKPLEEPYLRFPSADWESEPKKLGPDEYYVVGDNRTMPIQSHDQGATERNRIIGKIVFHGGM